MRRAQKPVLKTHGGANFGETQLALIFEELLRGKSLLQQT